MLARFRHQWFLLSLLGVVASGILLASVASAERLAPITDNAAIRHIIVATVLFLMALPQQPGDLWKTMRRPTAPLLAVAINFGVLPIVAWSISGWLSVPMAHGLMVAAATPCTMASAAVWTRRAGGNDGAAIMVTILTNLTCFAVTPLWVSITTSATGSSIELVPLIQKLAIVVVAPMILAQLLRRWSVVSEWADRQRQLSATVAQYGILTMVFIGSIRMGQWLLNDVANGFTILELVKMLLAVWFLHLSMWLLGIASGRAFGLSRLDWIAVGFSGSQKTLMVGLQMALDCGFTILPMVCYHISQLLIDTVLADHLAKKK